MNYDFHFWLANLSQIWPWGDFSEYLPTKTYHIFTTGNNKDFIKF